MSEGRRKVALRPPGRRFQGRPEAAPRPPQGCSKAALRPLLGRSKAGLRLLEGRSFRLPQGRSKAALRLPYKGYPKAALRLL